MDIAELAQHGFPEAVVEAWRSGVKRLHPLQRRALLETGLLKGENLIVLAPTGAGKTFIAEAAAMRHLQQGRNTVFLVPTKALAEQQYADFQRRYGRMMRVAIATRERRRQDDEIAAGRFDMAVMVYEKFRQFLIGKPAFGAHLGLVVVDELQLAGDTDRGPMVDLLLTRLAWCGNPVQLVCLSSVLPPDARVAEWLRATECVSSARPKGLREGVLCLETGMYRSRDCNTGEVHEERLLDGMPAASGAAAARQGAGPVQSRHMEALGALAREIHRRGEQLLVFVPSRNTSTAWARQLAQAMRAEPYPEASALFADFEPSRCRRVLEQCMAERTAFHNSDVPQGMRRVVEEEFVRGAIHVLVATTTLAQGVNLPMTNVVCTEKVVREDPFTGEVRRVTISRREFRNQGGRAGRPAGRGHFGRSIVFAQDERHAARLWSMLVEGEPEPLAASRKSAEMELFAADLIHARPHGIGESALWRMLLQTFAGRTEWARDEPRHKARFHDAVGNLREWNMVSGSSGALRLTGLGRTGVAYGIGAATAHEFARFIDGCCARSAAAGAAAASHDDLTPLDILLAVAFSPDGRRYALATRKSERAAGQWIKTLAARNHRAPETMPPILQAFYAPPGGFSDSDQDAVKRAIIADCWISDMPTMEIEEQFGIHMGALANLGAHFGWLCQAMSACARALGAPSSFCRLVSGLADRLPCGVGTEGAALLGLEPGGLTRGHVQALVRAGYTRAESLAAASDERLVALVPAFLVKAIRVSAGGAPSPAASTGTKAAPPIADSREDREPDAPVCLGAYDLVIDAAAPGNVTFRGHALLLHELPWKLLLLLARQPGRVVSRRQIVETIWIPLGAGVEDQQIDQHKRTILRRLGGFCPKGSDPVVLTQRGIGLILNIPAERVLVSNPALEAESAPLRPQ